MKQSSLRHEEYNSKFTVCCFFLEQILSYNKRLIVILRSLTHCERFSLAPTCNEVEALGLNSYSSALDVLFDIPEQERKIGKGQTQFEQ